MAIKPITSVKFKLHFNNPEMESRFAVKLFLLVLLVNLAKATIINDGKFPTTKFRILENHIIEFPNHFRPNAVARFSFEDANITRVDHKYASFWTMSMFGDNDYGAYVSNQSLAHTKSANYRFSLWHHYQKPSNKSMEICIDTSFNNEIGRAHV